MYQTLKIQVKDKDSKRYKQCFELCSRTAALYNFTNYHVRQHFFQYKYGISNGVKLEMEIKLKLDQNGEYPYYSLPTALSSALIRLCAQNWKSYEKATQEYHNNPSKFLGKPKIPKYLKGKKKLTVVNFDKRSFSLNVPGYIRCIPSFDLLDPIKIPEKLKGQSIIWLRIVPHHGIFDIEIVYEVKEVPLKPENNQALAIDLGVDNIVTIADNIGSLPIIIKGNTIKSINQHFNKEKAKLQSQLPKGVYTSKRIDQLCLKRQNQIRDAFHKITNTIVNYANNKGINTIVLGYNQGWKQKVKLGKKTNQKFVSIPYYKLKQMLEYKCKRKGINLKVVEESYTSARSAIDLESLDYHPNYTCKGKRITRGLFQSANGTLFNADVNAAYNILRKAGYKYTACYTLKQVHTIKFAAIAKSNPNNSRKKIVAIGYKPCARLAIVSTQAA